MARLRCSTEYLASSVRHFCSTMLACASQSFSSSLSFFSSLSLSWELCAWVSSGSAYKLAALYSSVQVGNDRRHPPAVTFGADPQSSNRVTAAAP